MSSFRTWLEECWLTEDVWIILHSFQSFFQTIDDSVQHIPNLLVVPILVPLKPALAACVGLGAQGVSDLKGQPTGL